ncbi:MAG: efflux RND transporter periplasmic adaptor subunit [Patescibacteria group bacterium]|nr:efflux RND transporter periplasmic adaptor subunit [Patescibacteria group bacterium]
MPFYKSKKFIIIAGIVVVIAALIGIGKYRAANAPVQYETAKVARGTIKQTVEATGNVKSADDLSLRFETAGTVGEVKVKEGDQVKTGAVLIQLRAADMNAAVAQAQANLNQKLAGATPEDIAYYRSAADSAKASLDQARVDGDYSIAAAELALNTARNNLKLAEGGESSQIVSDAYEDAVASLQYSLSTMDNSITQADNILGIDNTLANDSFESYLSAADSSRLVYANASYNLAKEAVNKARTAITPLTTQSAHTGIDTALGLAETSLNKCVQLLAATKEVLNATPPVGDLTQSALDTKKSAIETARTGAATYYNTIISKKQGIETAKNSYSTYTIAYDQAARNLDNARKTAASTVAIKEAAYAQAQANLDAKINPPREVDVAYLRAVLAQAIANRDKTILRAPIDGVVTKVNKKRGEFASATDVAVQMSGPQYEIDVDIPETDVSKLKVGDAVGITLDAFGDDVKFSGQVLSVEPASTEVQDVVYYKIKVTLGENDKEVKPGMTANVTINTASRENVLYIPTRAVRTNNNGEKYVRLLKNNNPTDVVIKVGLKADDGQIEVVEGLNEGDEVLLSIKTTQ